MDEKRVEQKGRPSEPSLPFLAQKLYGLPFFARHSPYVTIYQLKMGGFSYQTPPPTERESQRRLNAKSYFFRTAQNDFSARFRIGQKYAQPESALKPILDLFFFPRGVVFSQSPAKSLFFSV